MKKLIITVLIAVIAICTVEAQEGISISNFKADNISDSELLIAVDYSYPRDLKSKDVFIYAFPLMNDGRPNSRNFRIEHSPIKAGNHQANFKIYKRPGGKDFNSKSIKICIIMERSSLLCEVFPFAKSWVDIGNSAKIKSFFSSENQVKKGDSVTLTWETENTSKVMLGKFGTADFFEVPSSGSENVVIDRTSTYVLMASPKSSNGPTKVESKKIKISVTKNESDPSNSNLGETCTISGQLTGKWKQEIKEQTNGPTEIWIVNVFVLSKDTGKIIGGVSVDKTGRYKSEKLPAGNIYILRPEWKSNPRELTVSCEEKTNHPRIDFHITGKPMID